MVVSRSFTSHQKLEKPNSLLDEIATGPFGPFPISGRGRTTIFLEISTQAKNSKRFSLGFDGGRCSRSIRWKVSTCLMTLRVIPGLFGV